MHFAFFQKIPRTNRMSTFFFFFYKSYRIIIQKFSYSLNDAFSKKLPLFILKYFLSYLPISPLGQDMTQGQFLSGV